MCLDSWWLLWSWWCNYLSAGWCMVYDCVHIFKLDCHSCTCKLSCFSRTLEQDFLLADWKQYFHGVGWEFWQDFAWRICNNWFHAGDELVHLGAEVCGVALRGHGDGGVVLGLFCLVQSICSWLRGGILEQISRLNATERRSADDSMWVVRVSRAVSR